MPLVRPRLTDHYGILAAQENLSFAIPFLDEDIPLYVDPFLLWKSPSMQDTSLHTTLIAGFNGIGNMAARGGLLTESSERVLGDRVGWHHGQVEKIHATEFIRRFLLHVLPFRFVRIRYFGLLGNRYRKQNLERCRAMLHVDPPESPPENETFSERCLRLTGTDPTLCLACGEGRLVLRAMIPRPRFADLVARPAQSTKSPWAAASRGPPS